MSRTGGEHPDVQGWYTWFLQYVILVHPTLWSYTVSCGEFLVGVALVLGLFTGIAAFFGSLMNVNYLLAGAAGVNPILFAIATWLVLAWKVAGWWGLDRWALPLFSIPLGPGPVFHHRDDDEGQSQAIFHSSQA